MMITLHKLNGESFLLNATHIETIESKPDTVITLTNDRKYIVKETPEEVLVKIDNAIKNGVVLLK